MIHLDIDNHIAAMDEDDIPACERANRWDDYTAEQESNDEFYAAEAKAEQEGA